jgi:PAS domain S-box-containing protein
VQKKGTGPAIVGESRHTGLTMTAHPKAYSEVVNERHYPSPFERPAYSAIVQSVPHGVLLIDASLRIIFANRAAAELIGHPPGRLRGVLVARILPRDAVDLLLHDITPRRVRVVETCLSSTATQTYIRTIKITAGPLLNANGNPNRFRLLVIEDITAKATLEQQLVDSEKQAAMGQLAAGVLHEVSNPLTGLGSNLMFVRNALPANAGAELAQALDASLDQLEQMRQLLGTLSRLPGRAAPRYEPADLHRVIRECVAFVARDAERRRVRIETALSPAAARCEMDIRLIKQVLVNLLKNAMEAIGDGGRITVRTWHSATEGEADFMLIEVADTGVGIAECDLRFVFRPLFTTKRSGAGLGLSFCRQAVEEHGGHIRITSDGKNRGTTVRVSLPLRQPDNPDD